MHHAYTFRTLEKTLNNTRMPVELRVAAVEGLSSMGGRFARAALTGVINEDAAPLEVRIAAAKALGRTEGA
ncbi:hypothetical protein C7402_13133 [Paraburkholderia unamae]|uniref:HEAT repeat protein n=1 Tax=Paraburkholderia unamae TaxID=219649 RepID=A0ABX5K987_9BURK|nr:hypothetical protein [Paraburkholderia unamae]PVX71069.1 hypothetical protein C7402_13133 [Paraburkholderia unamae]RAR48771.1 hypothetical protein C7401_14948 [Paraburkholderia unamae]